MVSVDAWEFVRVYAAQSGGTDVVPDYYDIGKMLESGEPYFPGMPDSNLPTCPAWYAIQMLLDRGVTNKYCAVYVNYNREGRIRLANG